MTTNTKTKPVRPLADFRGRMSQGMYAELHYILCGLHGVSDIAVERVRINAGGYTSQGRYFGACAKGERIHRIDTPDGVHYVRSTLTARDLRSLFA